VELTQELVRRITAVTGDPRQTGFLSQQLSVALQQGNAALRKEAKYSTLQRTHLFQPVVAESLGTVEEATSSFLSELGHRISVLSGDNRETSFLFQRISVVVQRFNSVLLRESFSVDSRP